jgi:hypothetical protein
MEVTSSGTPTWGKGTASARLAHVESASSNWFNMLTRDRVVKVLECVNQEFEAATRDLYSWEARADLSSEVEGITQHVHDLRQV